MIKKTIIKGLNELTSVKFVLGVLTGCGMIAFMLANAVGII